MTLLFNNIYRIVLDIQCSLIFCYSTMASRRRSTRNDSVSSNESTLIEQQFTKVAATADQLLSYKAQEIQGIGSIPRIKINRTNSARDASDAAPAASVAAIHHPPSVDPSSNGLLIESINRLSIVVQELNSKVDTFGMQLHATTDALSAALCRVSQLEDINNRLQGNLNILRVENGSLSMRLDAIEQRQRDNFVILNGPRATEGLDQTNSNSEYTGNISSNFVTAKIKDNLKIDIPSESIVKVNFLGKDRKRILVELQNSNIKGQILSKISKVKPPHFFVNEFLTPRRSTLFYKLRRMQKGSTKRFHSAFTFKGDIFYKLNESSPKVRISSEADLLDLGKLLKIEVPEN